MCVCVCVCVCVCMCIGSCNSEKRAARLYCIVSHQPQLKLTYRVQIENIRGWLRETTTIDTTIYYYNLSTVLNLGLNFWHRSFLTIMAYHYPLFEFPCDSGFCLHARMQQIQCKIVHQIHDIMCV